MDQQELQRIAQLVEMNRQKMTRIEEQVTRLSEIRLEQLGVIASLKVLATQQPTMIPLGAGVQLPATRQVKPLSSTLALVYKRKSPVPKQSKFWNLVFKRLTKS